jgi:hypothetical protein
MSTSTQRLHPHPAKRSLAEASPPSPGPRAASPRLASVSLFHSKVPTMAALEQSTGQPRHKATHQAVAENRLDQSMLASPHDGMHSDHLYSSHVPYGELVGNEANTPPPRRAGKPAHCLGDELQTHAAAAGGGAACYTQDPVLAEFR